MNLKSYNGTVINNNNKYISINNFKNINAGFYLFFKYINKGNYVLNFNIEDLPKYFKIFFKHNNLKLKYLEIKSEICFQFKYDLHNVFIGILNPKKSDITLNVNFFKFNEIDTINSKFYNDHFCNIQLNKSKINDLVTILMPCFNGKAFLKNAIQSVIDQSYKNWELIIIDDYSSDDSVNIIKTFITNTNTNINKIKLIKNPMNFGTYYSLNEGLKIAKGDFITKLDTDDYYHKDKIRDQLFFCILNKIDCCSCNIIRFTNNNKKFILENKNSSILFSRNIFNSLGYYDNCRFEGDSEFFTRISKYYKIGYINKNLYYAHTSINSLTTSIITGVKINTIGNNIRKDFRNKYNKYNYKYICHPKYIRKHYNISPILRCPIEIVFIGNYKIIDNEQFIIEKLDNKLIGIVCYKLISEKNILYNPNKYNISITTIDRKIKLVDYSNRDKIYFNKKNKYILLVINFCKKIFKYNVPIIIPYINI